MTRMMADGDAEQPAAAAAEDALGETPVILVPPRPRTSLPTWPGPTEAIETPLDSKVPWSAIMAGAAAAWPIADAFVQLGLADQLHAFHLEEAAL